MGLSAPFIGTSRISIADSPVSRVNILTTRMPAERSDLKDHVPSLAQGFVPAGIRAGKRKDYRGSGPGCQRGVSGFLPTLRGWARAFHLLYGRLPQNILLHFNRKRACPKRRAE